MPFTEFGNLSSFFASTSNFISIATADGNTVVFYESSGVARAQIFDPTGQTAGDSFIFSNTLPASVLALSDGNIAVTSQNSEIIEIYSPDLLTQINRFSVNADSSIAGSVSLSIVPKGGFVATWARDGIGTQNTDVEFEFFDNNGTSISDVIRLDLPGDQSLATISHDNEESGLQYRVYYLDDSDNLFFQNYNASGNPNREPIQVNLPGSTVTEYSVVTLGNDNHVVVWEDSLGVHTGRIGTALSSIPFVVDLDPNGINPSVITTSDGGFIVAWVFASITAFSAEIRYFDSAGVLLESESIASARSVEIAVTSDGILSIMTRETAALTTEFFTIDGNDFSLTSGDDIKEGDERNNVMHGLSGDDELRGGDGDDTITGGTGEDLLFGDDGDDRFYETGVSSEIDVYDGGGDNDTLYAINEAYNSTVEFNLATNFQTVNGNNRDVLLNIENLTVGGDARIVGDDQDNILAAFDNAGFGDNIISGNDGNDTLFGNGGNDTLNGGDDNDILYGGTGNDTLDGGRGENELYGGEGDDTLIATGDKEVFDGGEGEDTLDFTQYNNDSQIDLINQIAETESGTNSVIGIENVIAGDGSDFIIGGDEDNHFIGNGGDDTFIGGFGIDVFEGGMGDDEVRYTDSLIAVNINLATSTYIGNVAAGDTFISIEDIFGSNFDDTLTGDDEDNQLSGGNGDDLLDGGEGADALIGGGNTSAGDTVTYAASGGTVIVNLTTGGIGNIAEGDTYSGIENIIGTNFQDSITGDYSANILSGGLGDDFLFGEGGDDTFVASAGADTFFGGTGNDTVDYTASDAGVTISLETGTAAGGYANGDSLTDIESITGSAFADILTGDDNDNTLDGGDENDTLRGGLGADTIIGGDGFDTASYADSNEGVTVSLRDNAPVATGGTAEGDTLSGIEGLIGSEFNDNLTGQENNVEDFIDAGDGNDTIYTRGGNDTIIAGDGDDHIIVSLNSDQFANSGDVTGGEGNDTLDFSGTGSNNSSQIIANLSTQAMTYITPLNTLITNTVEDEVTFSGIENLIGASSQDHLTGNAENNILRGLLGDDTLVGGAGADVLDGGEGNDTVDYSSSESGVTLNIAAGTGIGGDAQGDTLIDIEYVIGSDHNDFVRGSLLPNRFSMGDGNDTVVAGNRQALNEYDGGIGIDTISFAELDIGVTVDLDLLNGDVNAATLIGFENITGSNFNDDLVGNELDNIFIVNDGIDIVDGLDGDDTLVMQGFVRDWVVRFGSDDRIIIDDLGLGGDRTTFKNIEFLFSDDGQLNYVVSTSMGAKLEGDSDSDLFIGDSGENIITTFDGDDILIGGAGNDILDGGDDYDRAVIEGQLINFEFSIGSNGEIIASNTNGSGDVDTLIDIELIQFNQFPSIPDVLNLTTVLGNNGNNIINGSTLDEIILGANGSDTIFANAGTNALYGGLEADVLFSGSGSDLLDGGEGVDTADYSMSTAGVIVDIRDSGTNLTGGGYATGDILVDIENITGSDFDDTIFGDNNANILRGGRGNDTLNGVDGDDILYGGSGDDNLGGGRGDDLFYGGAGADSHDGGSGGEVDGDTVDYSASSEAITVNLVSSQGFGGDAEGDSYARIENIIGTQFDDTFVSSDSAERFVGGGGINTISYIDAESRVVVNLLTNVNSFYANGDDLVDIRNVIASVSNDTITGDAQDNVIEGLAGNNRLDGGDGIDTVSYILANTGVTVDLSDTEIQSTGISTDRLSNFENLLGSNFDDRLSGTSGVNIITGGFGDDILEGGGESDVLDGGEGSDTVSYSTAALGVVVNLATNIHSGADALGDDFISIENIVGSAMADTLTGDAGNNVIEGGLGANLLDGGDGVDTASYANASLGVSVSLALQGTSQNTIGAGDDILNNFENLLGSIHADTLTGDVNANVIEGGLGDDMIDGGGGNDTASYINDMFGVSIDLNLQGVAQDTLNSGMDTLINIENVTGSQLADILTGDMNANVIIGAGGIDTIDGGMGADTIFGGAEGDMLNGEAGGDTILGQGGDDVILGGADTDFLLGGDGIDTLFGEDGADQLFGENGDDTLFGQDGDDILLGGLGNDVLVGGEGTDTFFGEDGFDQLFGNEGGDVLFGQAGTDIIIAGSGGDFAFGGDDTDTIYGEDGNDQLNGQGGGDVIFGQVGEDIIYGNEGGDFLFGGDDTDTIYGGTQTDLLFGGMGGDVLFGEEGDDRIEGNEGGDFIFGGIGTDTAFGGDGVDQIYGEGDGDVLNGGADNDNLFGGEGGDFLFGDTGSDRLDGGTGNDQLYGGSNGILDTGVMDTFVFEQGFGIDTILDYELGIDQIEFNQIASLNEFADLVVTEELGNAVVAFGSDTITFVGISSIDLIANSSDFDFITV